MKFIPQTIREVVLIEPTVHGDTRGYFLETFKQELLDKALGYKINFVQDNESTSLKGVLRGLHYQAPGYAQAKLVRVISGRVLDVAVDIRKSRLTFGRYVSVELSGDNKKQLLVPHGFAHGFVVLSNSATFAYKVDSYYSPEYDRGIAFDDATLKIDWQLPLAQLSLSDKDQKHPSFNDATDLFE